MLFFRQMLLISVSLQNFACYISDLSLDISYVLERRFTKFGEITQYAVQGRSRSPILVPIQKFIYDFLLVINTNDFLSFTVSKLWLIIGQFR